MVVRPALDADVGPHHGQLAGVERHTVVGALQVVQALGRLGDLEVGHLQVHRLQPGRQRLHRLRLGIEFADDGRDEVDEERRRGLRRRREVGGGGNEGDRRSRRRRRRRAADAGGHVTGGRGRWGGGADARGPRGGRLGRAAWAGGRQAARRVVAALGEGRLDGPDEDEGDHDNRSRQDQTQDPAPPVPIAYQRSGHSPTSTRPVAASPISIFGLRHPGRMPEFSTAVRLLPRIPQQGIAGISPYRALAVYGESYETSSSTSIML